MAILIIYSFPSCSLKETISGLSVDEFMSAEERAGIEAAIAEKKKAAALAIQQQQAAAAGDVELAENGLAVAGMAATNGLAATEQGGAMPPAAIDAMEGVEMAGQKAASAAQASAQSPTAEEIKASWVGSQEALYLVRFVTYIGILEWAVHKQFCREPCLTCLSWAGDEGRAAEAQAL